MSEQQANQNDVERVPVLVEFMQPQGGVQYVSNVPQTPEEMAAKSETALQNAMGAIQSMVERVDVLIDDLAGNPDKLEFTFGLGFDIEGNAVVAKAGMQAAIGVKVTWDRKGRYGAAGTREGADG